MELLLSSFLTLATFGESPQLDSLRFLLLEVEPQGLPEIAKVESRGLSLSLDMIPVVFVSGELYREQKKDLLKIP